MSKRSEKFYADCKAVLTKDEGPQGRDEVRRLLEAALKDPQFVEESCGPQVKPGLYVLYEDPELKFQVLAHVNEKARVSPPHDHGDSWAIYGQATGHTDMSEYEREPASGDGKVSLRTLRTYRLMPGEAGIYADGMIHAIDYPEKSAFVRVTGTNLDQITRSMFDLKTGTERQMTPQRAS